MDKGTGGSLSKVLSRVQLVAAVGETMLEAPLVAGTTMETMINVLAHSQV
jgi:hypothetical protein